MGYALDLGSVRPPPRQQPPGAMSCAHCRMTRAAYVVTIEEGARQISALAETVEVHHLSGDILVPRTSVRAITMDRGWQRGWGSSTLPPALRLLTYGELLQYIRFHQKGTLHITLAASTLLRGVAICQHDDYICCEQADRHSALTLLV